MGCTASKHKFVPNLDIPGQSEGCWPFFTSLGLEDVDVDNIFHAFKEMDVHNSGFVRPIELFTYFSIELTGVESAIFGVFDDEKSGKLNFFELTVMLWDFLSLKEEALGIYIYLMKEPSGVMRIKYQDVKEVIELVHKRKVEASNALQTLFNDAKSKLPAEISLMDFARWASYNPSLVSPLLIIQLNIKKLLCGEKFWVKQAERRANHPEQCKVDYTKRLHAIIKKLNGDENYKRHQIEREKKVQSITTMSASQKNIQRKQSVLMAAFNLKKGASQVIPSGGEVNSPLSQPNSGSASEKTKSKKKLDTIVDPDLDSPVNTTATSKKEKSKSTDGSKKQRPSSASKKSSSDGGKEDKKGGISKEDSKRVALVKEDSKRGTLTKEDSKRGVLTKQDSKRSNLGKEDAPAKKAVTIADEGTSTKKKSEKSESKKNLTKEPSQAAMKKSSSKRKV